MPYLQIGGFKYIGDTLYFNLYNLNQYPAKITNGKIGTSNKPDFDMLDIAIGEAVPDSVSISEAIRDPKYSPRPIFDLSIINQYVIKESPVEIPFNEYLSMHANRNEAPYLTGRIEYNDEVGNTKRKYEFIVRLYGNRSNIKSEFEVNSNLPINYE